MDKTKKKSKVVKVVSDIKKPESKVSKPKVKEDKKKMKPMLKAIGITFIATLISCYIFFALTDVCMDGNKCYFIFGTTKLTYKEYLKADKNGNVIRQVNVWR